MTPEQRARALAEDIPLRPEAIPARRPWTPEEQAQHRADLLTALSEHETDLRRARLRLVPGDLRAAS